MADQNGQGALIRIIEPRDIPAVCELLSNGFPGRQRCYWDHALSVLAQRDAPLNYPRFGYLLQSGREIVGVILTIFSTHSEAGGVRCNLSSWYVDPRYRLGGYASALIAAALRFKEVTYINISPARQTWPVIEAQGFRRYSEGQMLCLPLLTAPTAGARAQIFNSSDDSAARLTADERQLLIEHQAYGCQALVVRHEDRVCPFVFLPRRVLQGALPTVQLIYCRDFGEFARYAHALGRALARRGRFSVLIDISARLKGLGGVYLRNRGPKYFKGPHEPRLGDLAYCESALFGP